MHSCHTVSALKCNAPPLVSRLSPHLAVADACAAEMGCMGTGVPIGSSGSGAEVTERGRGASPKWGRRGAGRGAPAGRDLGSSLRTRTCNEGVRGRTGGCSVNIGSGLKRE